MNERIREFAEQAFIVTTDGNIGHANEYMIENFAELIVRECITHLHKRGIEGFGILEERNLKEHFGVEE